MKFIQTKSLLLSILALANFKTSNAQNLKYHADSIEHGTILHAFCWSFNTIKEKLPEIQKAGYTAVQTSPIQTCKVGNNGSKKLDNWYYHYQPVSYEIGNYQLGSEDEFKSLCSTAKNYGIKIIVDAVLNHMTSDWNAIEPSLRNTDYYHEGGSISNWDDRYQVTQKSLLGLYDINTQHPTIQQKVLNFLKRAVNDGAAGFRYDAAKHIELPDDEGYGSQFWPVITNNGAEFQYGEILSDKVSRDSSYAKYLRMTASNYGNTVRNAISSNDFSVSKIKNYNTNVDSDKLITWVESHDNFSNAECESVWLTNEQIKLSWALLTARKSTTPLFFSRPVGSGGTTYDSRFPGKSMIGDEGDSLYKNDEIVAVNLFRNAMEGENEYLRNGNYSNKILMIERGTRGLVIINLNSQSTYLDNVTSLANGEYENQTNATNKFKVSNGRITGTLLGRSVTVLYNKSNQSSNSNSNSSTPVSGSNNKLTVYFEKPSSWKSTLYTYVYEENGGSIKQNAEWPGKIMTNVSNNIYKISIDSNLGNGYVIFTDNTQQVPKVGDPVFDIVDNGLYTISGYNRQYILTSASSNNNKSTIYFRKPSSWNKNINAYIYSLNSKVVSEISAWPGMKMNSVNDSIYSITVDNSFEGSYIIFNDNNQQIPVSGQPGFTIKNNGLYNSNGYEKQY